MEFYLFAIALDEALQLFLNLYNVKAILLKKSTSRQSLKITVDE